MPSNLEAFWFSVLGACAAAAPEPLYPGRYAKAAGVDRDKLDQALDELRKRGLVTLTEWVKDFGQGYALTDAGQDSLRAGRLMRIQPSAPAAEATAGHAMLPFERGELVRAAFLDPPTPWATRILLALNILYFAFGALYAMRQDLVVSDYLTGSSETTGRVLTELGALDPLYVFPPANFPLPRPQYERIVLSMFLHIGLLHLFMNMYFLAMLGPIIEAMWGSLRYAAIYLNSGIVSGCVVLLWALLNGERTLTAGASGALFGVFAGLLVWFVFNRRYMPRQFAQAWSRNLYINIFLLFMINFVSGVSWQGHLGGAIGGALTALLLHAQRFHPWASVRLAALVAVPLVPLGFFAAMLWQAGVL